jgi:amidase
VDVLVFPYSSDFASPINSPVYQAVDPDFVRSDVTSPATAAGYGSMGFPGIVVPMGFGTQGLPGSISFFGRPMDDHKLIGYAYDYEQSTLHRRPSPRVPPLDGEVINY